MGRSFRLVSPVYLLAGAISWPFVKVGFRLRARGREHLPQGGFVLAANHTSNLDPWPLGMPLLPRRQLRFMAKSELFNPVLAPFLSAAGAFRVRRGAGDVGAIRKGDEIVREGGLVVMLWDGSGLRGGVK